MHASIFCPLISRTQHYRFFQKDPRPLTDHLVLKKLQNGHLPRTLALYRGSPCQSQIFRLRTYTYSNWFLFRVPFIALPIPGSCMPPLVSSVHSACGREEDNYSYRSETSESSPTNLTRSTPSALYLPFVCEVHPPAS